MSQVTQQAAAAPARRSPRPYPAAKRAARRALLALGRVRRIHIIGCSRSGTSMFQLSLQAFERVAMYTREADAVHFPSLSDALGLAFNPTLRRQFYITKRQPHWYPPEALAALERECRTEGVGLIHLVRDPRDVMTSRHKKATDEPGQYYVDEELWKRSIDAADGLLGRLAGVVPVTVVRYEDICLQPARGLELLTSTFGLKLRRDVASWAALTSYVRGVSSQLINNMHGIRDIDARSIGRWSKNPETRAHVESLLRDSSIAAELKAFMSKYGYEPAAQVTGEVRV